MRQITTLLAVSTLVLAITSAYLYRQLGAARERNRRDVASEGDLRGEVARLEQNRTRLESDRRAPNPEPPPAAAPLTSPSIAPGVLPTSLPRLPEMTEEQRLGLARRRYRSMFKELELSDTEVAAILPVLAEQDLRANKPLPKELANRPQQDPQRDQSELAAVLGADKAERFTALRKLQPARSEVRMLRLRLEDTGEPLSEEQQEALLGIMGNKSTEALPQRIEGDDPQRSMERMNAWMREREQHLRQQAAPVLTAGQRQLLEEDAAFQDSMRLRAPPIIILQAGSGAPSARVP